VKSSGKPESFRRGNKGREGTIGETRRQTRRTSDPGKPQLAVLEKRETKTKKGEEDYMGINRSVRLEFHSKIRSRGRRGADKIGRFITGQSGLRKNFFI